MSWGTVRQVPFNALPEARRRVTDIAVRSVFWVSCGSGVGVYGAKAYCLCDAVWCRA